MTEHTQPQPEDLPMLDSEDDLAWNAEQPARPSESAGTEAETEDEEEILPAEDIGTNAQQVVSALLGHQRDLVAELRSVYERLEQVREVDHSALEARIAAAEQQVSAAPSSSELQELLGLLEGISATLEDQQAKQTDLEQSLKEAGESHAAQLAERDARIAAQNARIEQVESALVAAAESADSAHQKFEELAQEVQSSLIHRVGERVSPAAQQARNALSNIRRRFRK